MYDASSDRRNGGLIHMNPINETHPFMVSIWVKPTVEPGTRTFFDKPYWMEMARCQSDMRATEVAQCLSIRHRLVQVSQLQGDRFVQIKAYPDDEAVKRETQSGSKEVPHMAEHPPYEIRDHQQARTWRKWTYGATDEQLLAALRGAGDSF